MQHKKAVEIASFHAGGKRNVRNADAESEVVLNISFCAQKIDTLCLLLVFIVSFLDQSAHYDQKIAERIHAAVRILLANSVHFVNQCLHFAGVIKGKCVFFF